jgi:maleate cis-trans isomerase
MLAIAVLAALRRDFSKPVVSSNTAIMWCALREARVCEPISHYGRLLTLAAYCMLA